MTELLIAEQGMREEAQAQRDRLRYAREIDANTIRAQRKRADKAESELEDATRCVGLANVKNFSNMK